MTAEPRLSAALSDRYTILRELGQGGMATVYLAQDTRHERKVALKVLRPELAAVLGAERFLKEIKTTANLQHPHILPLHDSGEAGGVVFYVMPYVEGESLRDRLTRDKQLPVDEAVRIAREVLSALDYAHRHGVVHRDIKPENILLHDGQAFVADFGIALAVSTAGAATRMTETGMSLGTPHYMSPEQAMGEREVSARSDVYAMGCVLYEMLLGEPPFTGPTAQAIIARVITEEPRRLLAQRKTIPAHVEGAVLKALAKLPADRFANAAEFGEALVNPSASVVLPSDVRVAGHASAARAFDWRHPVVLGLGLLSLASASLAVWALQRERQVASIPPLKFDVVHDTAERLDWVYQHMAISHDGRSIAYAASRRGTTRLMLHRLSELAPQPLPGTEGARSPFFSPDGEWIAFSKSSELYKVSVGGGAPTLIRNLPAAYPDGSWGTDGWIVLASVPGLYRIRETGDSLEFLTRPDAGAGEQWHSRPQVLPGGRFILFDVTRADGNHPYLLDVTNRTWKDLALGVAPLVVYAASGHLLSPVANRLLAVPFDPLNGRITGSALLVDSLPVAGADSGRAIWAVASGPMGVVAILSGMGRRNDVQIITVDRTGAGMTVLPVRDEFAGLAVSRDGRRVAARARQNVDVYDLENGARTRLVVGDDPAWSPDSKRLVYGGYGQDLGTLWSIPADGGAAPELLFRSNGMAVWPYDWSPDGNGISYYEVNDTTNRDIHILRREDGTWRSVPFVVTRANERSGAFSPDGHWIAYTSDESGRDEIYVRGYPADDRKLLVSRDGGSEPVWSRDGRELFFRRGGDVLSVPVTPGPDLRLGTPRVLLSGRGNAFTGATGSRSYDVTPDGKRFVMRSAAVSMSPFTLTVLVNFQTTLAGR